MVAGVVAGTFRAVLGMSLVGDDYQWLQLAREALHRPSLMLADLDGFWRPTATWSLAACHVLWPFKAAPHHAFNLVLHALSAAALALAGRRLGLGWVAATLVALVWGCSPFAAEPAYAVVVRHEGFLLLAWLGLVLAWPGPGLGWSGWRLAAAVALTVLAAASKETFVVTPLLTAALAWGLERRSLRRALLASLPWLVAVAVYVSAHAALLPLRRSYLGLEPSTLAKLPHQLAAFLMLEDLRPAGFEWSRGGVAALVVVVALAVLLLARRSPAGSFGAALLVAASLPTLMVAFLPTRYTAIPYAGFALLLGAGVVEAAAVWPRARRVVLASGAAAAVAVLLVSWPVLVADLRDARAYSDAHTRLLADARRVAPELPLDAPVLLLRQERLNLGALLVNAMEGTAKPVFVRDADPYGLVDSAALFDWALGRDDRLVRRLDPAPAAPGPVFAHTEAGFVWLGQSRDLAASAAAAGAVSQPSRTLVVEDVSRTGVSR